MHCIGPFGTVFLNRVIPHIYFKSIEIHPLRYMEDGDPFVTYGTSRLSSPLPVAFIHLHFAFGQRVPPVLQSV